MILFQLVFLIVSACAPIPNAGYHGDILVLGVPGPVVAEFQLGEDLLVQTVHLDEFRIINLQINSDEEAYDDPLLYTSVLTIGRFSPLLGSGFTRGENIFYRKRLPNSGRDIFSVEGKRYIVSWEYNHRNPLTYFTTDFYTVTIQELLSK